MMDVVAVLNKKEITFKTEVCVGGWTRPGDVNCLYTPYGFLLSQDSPQDVVDMLVGSGVTSMPGSMAAIRALILRHNGTLLDIVKMSGGTMTAAIHYDVPSKGFLTYVPDTDGAPATMLDYLSTQPGFSTRTGIRTTMDVVRHLKQHHPISGAFRTLKINKILEELHRRYPTPHCNDVEKLFRSNYVPSNT